MLESTDEREGRGPRLARCFLSFIPPSPTGTLLTEAGTDVRREGKRCLYLAGADAVPSGCQKPLLWQLLPVLAPSAPSFIQTVRILPFVTSSGSLPTGVSCGAAP